MRWVGWVVVACVRAYVIAVEVLPDRRHRQVGVKRRDLIAELLELDHRLRRQNIRPDRQGLAELDEKGTERHQHAAQAADGRNLGWRAGGQVAFQGVQGDGRDPPGGGGGDLGDARDDGARPLRKVRGETLRVVHERQRVIALTAAHLDNLHGGAARRVVIVVDVGAAERRHHRRRLLVGLELCAHIGHLRGEAGWQRRRNLRLVVLKRLHNHRRRLPARVVWVPARILRRRGERIGKRSRQQQGGGRAREVHHRDAISGEVDRRRKGFARSSRPCLLRFDAGFGARPVSPYRREHRTYTPFAFY